MQHAPRACGATRNEGIHAPRAMYHMHHGLHFPIVETLVSSAFLLTPEMYELPFVY